MNFISIDNGQPGEQVKLYYEDLGKGKPIVFIHGWPMSHEMWEYQVSDLAHRDFRCITYDRRGFGKSSRPLSGYDYDTLADDLKAVLDALHLENVTLVGFSMGGGEVARYFSRHGGAHVSRVALVSSITPFLLKTEDNEEGVDGSIFEDIMEQLRNDRINFLDDFGKRLFGVGLINQPVSDAYLENIRDLSAKASPIATQKCAISFTQTDFRNDLTAINVPTLVIHGDADTIAPIFASGERTARLVPNCEYIVYNGEPHGLFYTRKEQLNCDITGFINTAPHRQQPVAGSTFSTLL